MNNKRQLNATQKKFFEAIDWDAFHKALSDKKSAKKIEDILKKVRY